MKTQLTKLHNDMVDISKKMSPVDYVEDQETYIVNSNQVVVGSIEVISPDETKREFLPTIIDPTTVQTKELSSHDLYVKSTGYISNLSVDTISLKTSSLLGITGCRGPAGYATNTGATGPCGPNIGLTGPTGCAGNMGKLIDLTDCPDKYQRGHYLVGDRDGIRFTNELEGTKLVLSHPEMRAPASLLVDTNRDLVIAGCEEVVFPSCLNVYDCTILPRQDDNAAMMTCYDGLWCYSLGKDQRNELSFTHQTGYQWECGSTITLNIHWMPSTIQQASIPITVRYILLDEGQVFAGYQTQRIVLETVGMDYRHAVAHVRIDAHGKSHGCLLTGHIARTGEDDGLDGDIMVLSITATMANTRLGKRVLT